MHIAPDQFGGEYLRDLGLINRYPLHIDILNNETGIALYVKTPVTDEYLWEPLFSYEVSDPDYWVYGSIADIYNNNELDLFIRVREIESNGRPGDWLYFLLSDERFTQNTNPPAALERLGFDEFDSVTWLTGLDANNKYQLQAWFDEDGNFELNSDEDIYSGIHNINTDPDAFNVDINGDGTMDYFIS